MPVTAVLEFKQPFIDVISVLLEFRNCHSHFLTVRCILSTAVCNFLFVIRSVPKKSNTYTTALGILFFRTDVIRGQILELTLEQLCPPLSFSDDPKTSFMDDPKRIAGMRVAGVGQEEKF